MRSLRQSSYNARRVFHSTASSSHVVFKQTPAPAPVSKPARAQPPPKPVARPAQEQPIPNRVSVAVKGKQPVRHVARNELGVQLLSRRLHEQVFPNTVSPPSSEQYTNIALSHLRAHGLDPSQGSVLPDTSFTLPPMQGSNLDEHFYRLGKDAAEPWLSLATDLSTVALPPKPDHWALESGWVKYTQDADGVCVHHHVPYPDEPALVFDVETIPAESPWAVMATAASKDAWYAWLSPWLLGETEDPQQLPSLGPPDAKRVVVGHNVSYDRLRLADEYALAGTGTRFLDTMSLHVAIGGISSHQRPAWMRHWKGKRARAGERLRQAEEVVLEAEIATLTERAAHAKDDAERAAIDARRDELRKRLIEHAHQDALNAEAEIDVDTETDSGAAAASRWEELSSGNSLADVAFLHCGIELDKEIRNDFMTCSRAHIAAGAQEYLSYCASDVAVTHAVYAQVLPAFRVACPSPVSFAGALAMGSAFLPVSGEWERYIERAESTYQALELKIRTRLVELAVQARDLMDGEKWRGDPWLEQLDWTPKLAGPSRGVEVATSPAADVQPGLANTLDPSAVPAWYNDICVPKPSSKMLHNILPLLLQVSYDSHPVNHSKEDGWHYLVDGQKQCWKSVRAVNVFNKQTAKYFETGRMSSANKKLALALCAGDLTDSDLARVHTLAKRVLKKTDRANVAEDPWLSQLDWTPVPPDQIQALPVSAAKVKKPKQGVLWPAWYWEQAKPKNLGVLDITVRNSLSPILLRLSWLGWPLFRSREHGWIFRVPRSQPFETRARALQFFHDDDATLATQSGQDGDGEFVFYKLPHKDGEEANVGSPLTKTFMKYAQDGTMTSPFPEARDALDMSAQCSYWISARDRIMSQMPVWQTPTRDLGFRVPADTPAPADKWGVILPQMTAMGTITRRAIERTWLTASNAKKNRVGSELKAMVRAPPGYALVGADVDAEELWISSLMGDAQFGLHGATAIGWMTLEGTKSAGTDLHSKTGSILRISRDQAKVFNYSRIYGAGMRHAILLLLQASAGMTPEKAHELAEELYAKTKGKNTYREDIFGRKFWYGGSESFVFNKLEEIAISDRPQTPALGCGVTSALAKQNLAPGFGNDYMTSRVNWVVQSSGVDYLHLLIVSMDHLIRKYGIRARYLISVHDEVRYLVHEEDRFRAALALQIANLWTRGLFAFKLGMDDLPQGVAFFSAVDVDSVLRKEADMTCVTPSQPTPLPPGESLGMEAILERTGGTLWQDARPMDVASTAPDALAPLGADYVQPNCLTHRAKSAEWLQAQSTSDLNEILLLATAATGFAPSRKPKRQYSPRKDTPRKPAVSTPDHDLDAMFLEQQASAGVGNVRRRDIRRMADEIFA